jgi:hypothetical protein
MELIISTAIKPYSSAAAASNTVVTGVQGGGAAAPFARAPVQGANRAAVSTGRGYGSLDHSATAGGGGEQGEDSAHGVTELTPMLASHQQYAGAARNEV